MTALDARAYLEKSIDNVEDLPDDLAWTNAEVLEMLREAVGLFEKAHTPTGDEREALARTIYLWDVAESVSSTTWEDLLDTQRDVWLEGADFVFGAGFRRTEVPEPSAETVLHLTDSLKMLRESLCAVQLGAAGSERMTHADRIGRIIAEIDRQRPLGSNGKHGSLHTPTCGCSGSGPQGEPSDAYLRAGALSMYRASPLLSMAGATTMFRDALRAAAPVNEQGESR